MARVKGWGMRFASGHLFTESGVRYLLYNPLVVVILVHVSRYLLQLEILRAEILGKKVRVGVKQPTSVPRRKDGEQGKRGPGTCAAGRGGGPTDLWLLMVTMEP